MKSPVYPELQIIIDCLKNVPENLFDMASSYGPELSQCFGKKPESPPECKTPCCIGGHAAYLLAGKMVQEKRHLPARLPLADALRKLCEIPYDIAERLCYYSKGVADFAPSEKQFKRYDEMTKEDAIAMLEHCRDTGEVIWPTIPRSDLT